MTAAIVGTATDGYMEREEMLNQSCGTCALGVLAEDFGSAEWSLESVEHVLRETSYTVRGTSGVA